MGLLLNGLSCDLRVHCTPAIGHCVGHFVGLKAFVLLVRCFPFSYSCFDDTKGRKYYSGSCWVDDPTLATRLQILAVPEKISADNADLRGKRRDRSAQSVNPQSPRSGVHRSNLIDGTRRLDDTTTATAWRLEWLLRVNVDGNSSTSSTSSHRQYRQLVYILRFGRWREVCSEVCGTSSCDLHTQGLVNLQRSIFLPVVIYYTFSYSACSDINGGTVYYNNVAVDPSWNGIQWFMCM